MATRCPKESNTAPRQKFPLAKVGKLLSPDELHIAIDLQTSAKFLKAQTAAAAKLLMNLDSMTSLALKAQVASLDSQP